MDIYIVMENTGNWSATLSNPFHSYKDARNHVISILKCHYTYQTLSNGNSMLDLYISFLPEKEPNGEGWLVSVEHWTIYKFSVNVIENSEK